MHTDHNDTKQTKPAPVDMSSQNPAEEVKKRKRRPRGFAKVAPKMFKLRDGSEVSLQERDRITKKNREGLRPDIDPKIWSQWLKEELNHRHEGKQPSAARRVQLAHRAVRSKIIAAMDSIEFVPTELPKLVWGYLKFKETWENVEDHGVSLLEWWAPGNENQPPTECMARHSLADQAADVYHIAHSPDLERSRETEGSKMFLLLFLAAMIKYNELPELNEQTHLTRGSLRQEFERLYKKATSKEQSHPALLRDELKNHLIQLQDAIEGVVTES